MSHHRPASVAAIAFVLASLARAELVGYWPLDGNAKAAVGTDGVPSGGPTPTADRTGKAAMAMAFDGTKQQHVAIPYGGGLDGRAAGTLSLWVKWDGRAQGAALPGVVCGAVVGRQKNGRWSSNLVGLSGPDPATARVRWRAGLQHGGPVDGSTSPGRGTWHHVAVTFGAGRHVLYVDGEAEGARDEAQPLNGDADVRLTLGAWIGDGASFATASLDDVAVFCEPLSPEQVAALARGEATPRTVLPPPPDLAKALWLWTSREALTKGEPTCLFRKTFALPAKPSRAAVLITVDNDYSLHVNGKLVGADGGHDSGYWRSVERYDIGTLLVAGRNAIAVRGQCLGGAAGLLAAARIELPDGSVVELRSDRSWRIRRQAETGWTGRTFDDGHWPQAAELGPVGVGVWGKIAYPGPPSPSRRGRAVLAEADAGFAWPDGMVFLRGYVRVERGGAFAIVRVAGTRAYTELDAPSPAALGTQLCSLVPARPDAEPRVIHDAGRGVLGPPTVSWDARTVYFSMAAAGDKFFRVCRIRADGSGLRVLTRGPYHDYDPQPLPDGGSPPDGGELPPGSGGRIVFSSTRIGSRDEYHGNVGSSLFVMDADGGNVRPLTHHIVGDHEPRVTAAGGIVFIRRDNFIERAKVETRLHHIRPDGTGGIVVLGAARGAIGLDRLRAAERNAAWLRAYGFGCPAPLPDGRVAALSNYGVVVSGAVGSGATAAERVPSPFVPFDIAPLPDGRLLCTAPGRDAIGVLDPASGKAVRLLTSAGADVHSPAYLGPRPTPPQVASQVERRADETGVLVCQSVFHTKQTNAGLARIKAVRVYEGRPFVLRSVRHGLVHLGVESVELGTAPLAPDGSFHVRVPADRALAIQAVDGEGRPVISELSWIYVRPGERRTCVGCHSPRAAAPQGAGDALAARFEPLTLTGQGDAHRYRGNNGGNGGVLNLQLDRFREAASINLYRQAPLDAAQAGQPLPPGRPTEVARLCARLADGDVAVRLAAARRLAIFRDRGATASLVDALDDPSCDVRVAAAVALSACGNRDAVGPLLDALADGHPLAAQAANAALEHLTGHTVGLNALVEGGRERGARAWRRWRADHGWDAVETALIARLADADPIVVHQAAEALGHVGGDAARAALREFLKQHRDGGLRILMAALRALGHLRDAEAVPLLTGILNDNARKPPRKAPDLHELGWLQRPLQLAATAAEALGWIATPEAEQALLAAIPRLDAFWNYTFAMGHHDWLRGCHASVVHYRILEALDALGTRNVVAIVPAVLRSVPIDPDRALLFESDAYETLAARIVQRAGMTAAVADACLAVLGDPDARADEPLRGAVTASPPAREVKPLSAQARAAQIASVVCLHARHGPRLRAALARYRAMPPSRKRSWVCFFLARALGRARDRDGAKALLAALGDPTEASFGFEDPPHVFIYKAMTPFHRAAVAYALGETGAAEAVPTLLETVTDLDNAMSVRHAAAQALGMLCGRSHAPRLRTLAADYPEIATRRALLDACRRADAR